MLRLPLPDSLSPGAHLIAISLHNTERNSTDLRLAGVTLVGLKQDADTSRETDRSAALQARARELRDELNAYKEKSENALLLPSLAEMQPFHLPRLNHRAESRARRGKWADARADMERMLELDPEHRSYWCKLAPLLVQTGDRNAYRRHRHAMMARFTEGKGASDYEYVAKNALLLPVEGEDLETATRLAETSVSLGKSSGFAPYYRFVSGLAQFRRGQFAEAIAKQRTVVSSQGVPEREMQAHAVMAMCHHQLNQPEEARAALKCAVELATSKLPPLEDNEHVHWGDLVIAHILLREAQALIGGK
jgi:Flp pilus assembly protein TadD